MSSTKDFEIRWSIKSIIDKKDIPIDFYVNEREVWYISMWINIWFEQNGKGLDYKRPVLVLRKLWNVFLVVAMTTKWKNNNFFYYKLPYFYHNKDSYIILSQIKVIDKKRFIEKMYTISKQDFSKIKNTLKQRLF